MRLRNKLLLSAVLLNLLAACGDSSYYSNDDGAASDDRRVPSSALVSARAYSEWAASLVNSDTESGVLIDADMMAPKSESEEPIALR